MTDATWLSRPPSCWPSCCAGAGPFGGVPIATVAMSQAAGPLAPVVRLFGALLLTALTVTVGVDHGRNSKAAPGPSRTGGADGCRGGCCGAAGTRSPYRRVGSSGGRAGWRSPEYASRHLCRPGRVRAPSDRLRADSDAGGLGPVARGRRTHQPRYRHYPGPMRSAPAHRDRGTPPAFGPCYRARRGLWWPASSNAASKAMPTSTSRPCSTPAAISSTATTR